MRRRIFLVILAVHGVALVKRLTATINTIYTSLRAMLSGRYSFIAARMHPFLPFVI